MARVETSPQQSRAPALLWGVALVASFYFAREVLLPFALAILFSFLVAPVVDQLERWRWPRVPAVLAVVVMGFLGLGTFSYVVFSQVYDLAYQLPEYESNLTNKAKLFQSSGEGVLSHVTKAFNHIQRNLKKADRHDTSSSATAEVDSGPGTAPEQVGSNALGGQHGPGAAPVSVQIVDVVSPETIIPRIVAFAAGPLGSGAVVIILVIFMLLEREDLRNRLIHLIGPRQLNSTTQAMDDAAHRVSRYLRMQLIINSLFGGVALVGLSLIGVPNAPLWGICAALLRFIPYVGPVAAALIPLALSLALFDGWSRPGLVVLLFTVDELVAGNVLEPRFYATSTSISGLGVIVASVFWMWLWGPVGLILAMPLTVCLVVMGSYVPQLNFLNTLLADRNVLSPASRYYQRLLASDPEEALEVAEEFLQKNSVETLYDAVIIPALTLAENDRHHGDLADSKQELIIRTTRELVEDLGGRVQVEALALKNSIEPQAAGAGADVPVSVLCLPSRDEADEIVGMMLAQLLATRDVRARVLSVNSLASEMVTEVNRDNPAVVCVSALPPFAGTHARYLCKRLAPAIGKVPLVAGLWQVAGGEKKAEAKLSETGVSKCVTTVTEAAEYIAHIAVAAKLLRSA